MQKPLVIALLILCHAGLQGAEKPRFKPGVRLGIWKKEKAQINESSGIAQSWTGKDIFWTHNDNGNKWLACSRKDGTYLGRLNLKVSVTMRDTEDIATGPGPIKGKSYIYYGDHGDNGATRKEGIHVCRILEPDINGPFKSLTVDCDVFNFQYPDGPRDCETLMVDPLTKDWYFVSKRDECGRVYVARYPQKPDHMTTLKYLGLVHESAGRGITGGDISTDGKEIIVCKGSQAILWQRQPSQSIYEAMVTKPTKVPLDVKMPQREGICWANDSSGFYVSSEGPMYLVHYARTKTPPKKKRKKKKSKR